MLTTKFRTTIVLLVASATVAVGLAPATPAAFARKKRPCGNACLQRLATKQGGVCSELFNDWNQAVAELEAAILSGDEQAEHDAGTQAVIDYNAAHDAGCKWAQRVKPRNNRGFEAPPSGGTVGSNPSGQTGGTASTAGIEASTPSGNAGPSSGGTGSPPPGGLQYPP